MHTQTADIGIYQLLSNWLESSAEKPAEGLSEVPAEHRMPCRPHPHAASSEHQPAQEGWEDGKLKHEGPPHLGDVKPGRSDLLQLTRCSLSGLRELGASEQETDLFQQGPILILPRR